MAKIKTSYSNLIRELAVTDFKLKYQGSILGYLWSFAKPLMLFGVLYFVFTRIIRLGAGVPHYPLYLLLGIVLWSYFSDSTIAAMNSIVDRQDVIRKVYFPRIVIVIAASISSLITLALNLAVIVVFMLLAHLRPGVAALWFLPLIVEMYVLALGFALFLSALFVKFRDVKHIWEVGLQILFYATPIIYPLSLVPARYVGYAALNPIAQIIQDSRHLLITPTALTSGNVLHYPWVLIPYVIPPLVALAGFRYFNSVAAKFAEEI